MTKNEKLGFLEKRLLKLLWEIAKKGRKANRFNKSELSRITKTDRTYYSEFENWNINISITKLMQIITRFENWDIMEKLINTLLEYKDLKYLEEWIMSFDIVYISHSQEKAKFISRKINEYYNYNNDDNNIDYYYLELQKVYGNLDLNFILNDGDTLTKLFNFLTKIHSKTEEELRNNVKLREKYKDNKECKTFNDYRFVFKGYRHEDKDYLKLINFIEKNSILELKKFFDDLEKEDKDNKNEVE